MAEKSDGRSQGFAGHSVLTMASQHVVECSSSPQEAHFPELPVRGPCPLPVVGGMTGKHSLLHCAEIVPMCPCAWDLGQSNPAPCPQPGVEPASSTNMLTCIFPSRPLPASAPTAMHTCPAHKYLILCSCQPPLIGLMLPEEQPKAALVADVGLIENKEPDHQALSTVSLPAALLTGLSPKCN